MIDELMEQNQNNKSFLEHRDLILDFAFSAINGKLDIFFYIEDESDLDSYGLCYPARKEIYINYPKLKLDFPEEKDLIVQLKGTILHELGHMVYDGKMSDSDWEFMAQVFALQRSLEMKELEVFQALYRDIVELWSEFRWNERRIYRNASKKFRKTFLDKYNV
jgi:hypothetical protein